MLHTDIIHKIICYIQKCTYKKYIQNQHTETKPQLLIKFYLLLLYIKKDYTNTSEFTV